MGLLDKAARRSETLEIDKAAPELQDSARLLSKKIRDFIEEYRRGNGSSLFQGIVVDISSEAGGENVNLSGMVSHFGSVYALPGGKRLLLVPAGFDRELLAHRLSKTAAVLRQFRADSVEAALRELRPCL